MGTAESRGVAIVKMPVIPKSKSIVLPRIPSLPPYAVDYKTKQSGQITVQKAKDIVFAAVLNNDSITIEQDNNIGIVIIIVDRIDIERAKESVEIIFKEKGNA
jgi:hypothetical protein